MEPRAVAEPTRGQLKAALQERRAPDERLSPLHPRALPLKGWWRGGVDLEVPAPEGWPLPLGAAVIESRSGYRFGPENLSLAWALDGLSAQCIIDLGAGSGSLGIIALYSTEARQLIAVERQAQQLERLERTLAAFRSAAQLSAELSLLHGDLRDPQLIERARALTPEGAGADLIVLNPPFFPVGWGRESGEEEVKASTHALAGDVSDFFAAAASLLSPDGQLCALYDAHRMADLLPALSRAGLSIRAIKYSPDARPDRAQQPFRVWLFAARVTEGAQGALVSALLPHSLSSMDTQEA